LFPLLLLHILSLPPTLSQSSTCSSLPQTPLNFFCSSKPTWFLLFLKAHLISSLHQSPLNLLSSSKPT
jgi:hypothetical protein